MPDCYNKISMASENGVQGFSGPISHGYKVSPSLFVLLLIVLKLLPEGSRFERLQPECEASVRIYPVQPPLVSLVPMRSLTTTHKVAPRAFRPVTCSPDSCSYLQ